MEKQPAVVFRNVGQMYFPQTRVECHYSLTSGHRWSSSDWIGIFQLGWSSVKEYYTYTWALVPEGYTEGSGVDSCALFHASYLPRPGTSEYQFVYVDKLGKVCARSRPFTFCAPKPLEELETLKEEQDEEDGGEELLLVIPRAQLLQSRLEECLKKQTGLQRALDVARKETENEKQVNKRARSEWEREREAMKEKISELRDNLRHSCEMLRRMEGKQQDGKYNQENLTNELNKLVAENAENQQQIKDLEDKIRLLTDRETAACSELERLREKVKKMSIQMKHDEEKRKSLQVEIEASAAEVRGLQERLESNELVIESQRRELKELGARQNLTYAELHQARLQVAQLNLQLSEEDLVLREERANSALEKEAYKHAAEMNKNKLQDLSCELQRTEQWLQDERMDRDSLEAELQREKVLLSEARQELQEAKTSLRRIQKDREEEKLQRQLCPLQDLVSYIHQLELRLGIATETNGRSLESSGDERDDEDSSRPDSYPVSDPEEPPAEGKGETTDAQEEKKQSCEAGAAGEQHLIPPELLNPVLSELADAPMW
ncbi:calcium-binding and coiled-coil domain-containing protein 1 isoform X1 [Oryzias melastigma]|uniref:calcium-binding and coiled-coil domain-containing protein 1 isoform X1 n=1 Tax=Oryzias melastigma TaxID=30732 RepID=UPI00168D79A8|nr:calcium-binding and coiled-coil domain-containing protein 1 isoform X1 [Oryzias melastigma]